MIEDLCLSLALVVFYFDMRKKLQFLQVQINQKPKAPGIYCHTFKTKNLHKRED
jgi:hypothetical protein